jgi:hypothetical protein
MSDKERIFTQEEVDVAMQIVEDVYMKLPRGVSLGECCEDIAIGILSAMGKIEE